MNASPMHVISDSELVARVLERRDESAFRELYERHTGRVYAMMLRLLGSEHDAEDVVQEAWTRALQAAPRFRWEASFASWLTAIALNCARALHRRNRLHATTDIPEHTPSVYEWDAADARLDVQHVLKCLPTGYRAVITLYHLEGEPHEEIARRLNIAAGTSKSQLHHARRYARNLLQPTLPARLSA